VCAKYTPTRGAVHPIDHSTHNTEETAERCRQEPKRSGGQAQAPSPRAEEWVLSWRLWSGSDSYRGGCGAEVDPVVEVVERKPFSTASEILGEMNGTNIKNC
jgi:hypothetical protein